MTDSPFTDKTSPPDPDALATALGRSSALFERLRGALAEDHGPVTETWKFYRNWTLQVRAKKRTVLWLNPRRKHFIASAAFGEKAVAAVQASDLPAETKEMVATAQKYAEGRAVRLEVRIRQDFETVRTLAALRMGT